MRLTEDQILWAIQELAARTLEPAKFWEYKGEVLDALRDYLLEQDDVEDQVE